MRKLTPKQETYCQARADGMNLSDAYRSAYVTDSMKDITVNNEASKLENNPIIAARLTELNERAAAKLEAKRVASQEEVLELLTNAAKTAAVTIPVANNDGDQIHGITPDGEVVEARKFVDPGLLSKSVDQLMKFHGLFEADKTRNVNHGMNEEMARAMKEFFELPDTTGLPKQ